MSFWENNLPDKMSKLKLFLVILVVLITAGVFLVYQSHETPRNSNIAPDPTPQLESNSPTIVSTNPDPLEGAVVPTDQIIEITFSHPLENEPELRRRFDPEIKYKVELSSDKRMVKFIPEKPFELGLGYTLFILPETKFVGGGKLDGEKTFHFNTIKYRGV